MPRGSTGRRVTSGSRRSSCGRRRRCSGSRSCCRRRPGTPTTTTTATATASATRGTRCCRRSASTSPARTCGAACPSDSAATTCSSSTGWRSRGHAVDTYADEDIELFPTPQALRAAYDLIVFPGHTEYVTSRLYDLIRVYRDLGGRLIFLSANNFFRHVKRTGERGAPDRRVAQRRAARVGAARRPVPRKRRRPAAAAVHGVRRRRVAWAVRAARARERLAIRRYGIEIDARTPASPPGTQVLATIPDLLGPGRTAEMTYYETPNGAEVFSAACSTSAAR